jgi:hypothetical protein
MLCSSGSASFVMALQVIAAVLEEAKGEIMRVKAAAASAAAAAAAAAPTPAVAEPEAQADSGTS